MSESIARENETTAMRSPLGWALLGLLIERPSYGYELVARFQSTYGNTLVLSSGSHIYRLLELLRSHSMIEEIEAGTQKSALPRQPKPHYRATAQGVRAYKDWLVVQLGEERHRQQLFARQLAMLEPEAALAVVEATERECLQEAGEAPQASEESSPGDGPSGVAKRLADEEERLALGVRLSWMEYARTELKALIDERAKKK